MVRDFQHDPRLSRLELRHADLLQQAVVHVEGFAQQRRRQIGIEQIEKDSLGMLDALRLELYFLLQSDGDPGVLRGGPVADAR